MKYYRFDFRRLPYQDTKGLTPQDCLLKVSPQCRNTFIKSRVNQENCDKCLQHTNTIFLFPIIKEVELVFHTNRYATKVCKDCEKKFTGGYRSYRCPDCQLITHTLRWSNRRRIIPDTDIPNS